MTAHFFGAVGDGDRLERTAVLEGLLSDGLDLATKCEFLKFSTFIECLVADCLDRVGNNNARQGGAIRESTRIDVHDTFLNGEAGQV